MMVIFYDVGPARDEAFLTLPGFYQLTGCTKFHFRKRLIAVFYSFSGPIAGEMTRAGRINIGL